MIDAGSRWQLTGSLGRALAVGGVGLALALAIGRPALVVVVAPLVVAGALGLVHKPTHEPMVYASLAHLQLHEGQGTRSRLQATGTEDVEHVARVASPQPYIAVHPHEGALGHLLRPGEGVAPLEISPRRWGRRLVGAEKVALTSAWAGYRWGPTPLVGREMSVLPTLTHFRAGGEAPQPIGLIGAHRSRRDGDGTEFSSIRAFHPGDRLRRINWRVSLKEGSLHVESTRAEEDAAVLLIVDALADYGMSGGVESTDSSLDVTVRAAAALADQYVGGGDRVSLRVLSPGGEYVGYGTGTRHLRRILILLSNVRPGVPRDVAIDQIDFRTTAGTVVVVISPMLSEPLATATVRLARRGLPVIVIDPLPAGTIPSVHPDVDDEVADLAWRMRLLDRSHLLARLASSGCPVVPWNGPRTLEEILRRLARRGQVPRVGGGAG
ncbi:MAG TPA: DUF58 domain-containing protein [Nocardioides sp.]|uniref:DUF58 domain-containing protein n=1 Tax=Nocardioides sp. TaxID=35761 RepID=UPI002F41C2D1